MIARDQDRWAEWGYSWWALPDRDTGELIGAGGIQHQGRAQHVHVGIVVRRLRL